MFSYEPLFEYMKERKITYTHIIRAGICTSGTLNAMKHNKPINMNILDKFLNFLGCDISDAVKHIPEKYIPKPLRTP